MTCSIFLMPLTMSSVEVVPFLNTLSSTERLPSTCTILVCTALPSCTWATSCMYTIAPPTLLIGRSPSSGIFDGALLRLTLYS